MITTQYSRIAHHRVTTPGDIATVPASNDFTDGSWLVTDINLGEIMINMADDKAWFRTDNGIVEFATIGGSSANLAEVLASGNTSGVNDIVMDNGQVITSSNNYGSPPLSPRLELDYLVGGDVSLNAGDHITTPSLRLSWWDDTSEIQSSNAAATIRTTGTSCQFETANSVMTLDGGTDSLQLVLNVSGFGPQLTISSNSGNETFFVENSSLKFTNSSFGTQGFFSLGGQTINATPTVIYDWYGNSFPVTSGSSYRVQIRVIASDFNVNIGDTKEWEGFGIIKNVGGTTSLVGGTLLLTSTVGDASLATTSITATANNTNDTLELTATGIAVTGINWQVSIQYVQVNI